MSDRISIHKSTYNVEILIKKNFDEKSRAIKHSNAVHTFLVIAFRGLNL
tara:strand:- start:54 stop:200 length:147 start_codon:yes stop_codon:yes gene_type:complete